MAADTDIADAPEDMMGAPGDAPEIEDLLESPDSPDVISTITDLVELAALDPPFAAYLGVDYGPATVPPPMVTITDLDGMVVDDAAECALECAELPECNSASYYGDNPSDDWPGVLALW